MVSPFSIHGRGTKTPRCVQTGPCVTVLQKNNFPNFQTFSSFKRKKIQKLTIWVSEINNEAVSKAAYSSKNQTLFFVCVNAD
jgi:hypothetical protein